MKCKKCEKEIDNISKFCPYCGEIIEQENNEDAAVDKIIDIINDDRVDNTNVDAVVSDSTETNVDTQKLEITNQEVLTNQPENNKKNGGKIAIIITSITLLVVAIVAAIVLFTLKFSNRKSSNIDVLKKALYNLEEKADESGTIDVKLLGESKTQDSFNFSFKIKYAKLNDNYDLSFKLNESLFFDEVNLYSRINEENLKLYAQSDLLDTIIGTNNPNENMWIYYLLDLKDIDFEDDDSDDLDLSKIIDEKHFKYVDESEGIKHYQLIIDKELMEKIKNQLPKDEIGEFEDSFNDLQIEDYAVDFYINKSNDLVKISMEITDDLQESELSKISLSIEFSDLNNTVVTIPQDVLNSNTDIESYIKSMYDVENNNTESIY